MKKYKHVKDKKPTERVSFYIALSVCMMAVGLAAWSAYSTFSEGPEPSSDTYFSSMSTENAPVAQNLTGVTEGPTQPPTAAQTEAPTARPTEPSEKERSFVISEEQPSETEKETDADTNTKDPDPLQAVMQIKEDLVYPVKSRRVAKAYSEDVVYNSTLRDYRAHTGCDFSAEQGENVYMMCDGIVKEISVSELYGAIIEVDCGSFSVYYCGLDTDFMVEKDEELQAGDTIGTVGVIPSESEDEPHIHVEIRVGNRTVDPLSVIESDR